MTSSRHPLASEQPVGQHSSKHMGMSSKDSTSAQSSFGSATWLTTSSAIFLTAERFPIPRLWRAMKRHVARRSSQSKSYECRKRQLNQLADRPPLPNQPFHLVQSARQLEHCAREMYAVRSNIEPNSKSHVRHELPQFSVANSPTMPLAALFAQPVQTDTRRHQRLAN